MSFWPMLGRWMVGEIEEMPMSKEKSLLLKADDNIVNLILLEINGIMYARRPNIETKEENTATRSYEGAQGQD